MSVFLVVTRMQTAVKSHCWNDVVFASFCDDERTVLPIHISTLWGLLKRHSKCCGIIVPSSLGQNADVVGDPLSSHP